MRLTRPLKCYPRRRSAFLGPQSVLPSFRRELRNSEAPGIELRLLSRQSSIWTGIKRRSTSRLGLKQPIRAHYKAIRSRKLLSSRMKCTSGSGSFEACRVTTSSRLPPRNQFTSQSSSKALIRGLVIMKNRLLCTPIETCQLSWSLRLATLLSKFSPSVLPLLTSQVSSLSRPKSEVMQSYQLLSVRLQPQSTIATRLP